MPRAAHSVLERLGEGDLDRFIDDAARRERARRALLQRKAGAATGGVLAAFLAAAGAEAREGLSFAQPEAGISPDDYRVVDAGDILSFAEICATEGEGSIFDHALHAARTLASASFEKGFASRLASRFAAEHDDHRGDGHAAAAHDAGHGDQQGRRAMSAHSSHSDEAGAVASGHGGHEGGAGAEKAPAEHSTHEGEGEESLAFAAALGGGSHGDHAGGAIREYSGGAIEQHTAGSHAGGIVDDVAGLDLDEALTALLGAQEPTEAPAAVTTTAAPDGHQLHASLIVEAPPPELLVAPLAEI